MCEKTLDPVWENERFVFDVPESAILNTKSHLVRVVVKSRTPLGGLSIDLGQTDISFTSKGLQDEKVVEGWFPLHPRKSLFSTKSSIKKDLGFIRLRFRWIHTDKGLLDNTMETLNDRIDYLRNIKDEYTLKLSDIFKSKVAHNDSVGNAHEKIEGRYMATMAGEILRGPGYLLRSGSSFVASLAQYAGNPVNLSSRSRLGSSASSQKYTFSCKNNSTKSAASDFNDHNSEASLEIHIGAGRNHSHSRADEELIGSFKSESEQRLEKISQEFHPSVAQILSDAVNRSYSSVMRFIVMKKAVSRFTDEGNYQSTMNRKKQHLEKDALFLRQYLRFESHFETNAQRAFKFAHTIRGDASIMPVEVRNVPAWGNVFIKISYYTESKSTFSIPPATTLSWIAPEHIKEQLSSIESVLEKVFDIDTMNIRGPIRVSVIEDNNVFSREIAYVEIPVLRFIDCTCILSEGEYYDRYFPLTILNSNLHQVSLKFDLKDINLRNICFFFFQESMFSMIEKQFTEKVSIDDFGMLHNLPCINLRMRWTEKMSSVIVEGQPRARNISTVPIRHPPSKPVWYVHTRLRRFSMSIIDDNLQNEIMEFTLDGIDYRIAGNETCFDHSLNMDSLQIDNHLPQATVKVILAQKPVRYLQPVLRFHATFNRKTSHNKLICFDTIELVIQELDLKLEQQTIIICWVFIEDLLRYLETSRSDEQFANNGVFGHLGFNHVLVKSHNIDVKLGSEKSTSVDVELFDEEKLYIDEFLLCMIKINISFITTPVTIISGFSSNIDTEKVKKSFSSSNNRLLYASITAFLARVGEVVLGLTTSISDAPIYLNGKAINHFFVIFNFKYRLHIIEYLMFIFASYYRVICIQTNCYSLCSSIIFLQLLVNFTKLLDR